MLSFSKWPRAIRYPYQRLVNCAAHGPGARGYRSHVPKTQAIYRAAATPKTGHPANSVVKPIRELFPSLVPKTLKVKEYIFFEEH